jgi:hypothetical protein
MTLSEFEFNRGVATSSESRQVSESFIFIVVFACLALFFLLLFYIELRAAAPFGVFNLSQSKYLLLSPLAFLTLMLCSHFGFRLVLITSRFASV